MVRLFVQIYDILSKRRWLSLSLALGLLFISLFLSSRIDYEEDISAFLPKTAQTEEYMAVYAEMGGQDRIAVLFRGDSLNLVPAMDSFGELLVEQDTCGMVHDLQVTVDEDHMFALMNYVWQNYPLLLSETDYAHFDSLLTEEYIHRQMMENHRMTMMPIGGVMTQSLPYDPLHLSMSVTNSLQHNELSNHYQLIDGHIFSKDGQCGLVLLSSHFGISESKKNERLIELIQTVSDSIMSRYERIVVTSIGAPVIAVGNASQIKKDSMLAVSFSVFLIFSTLYYSFRRWRDIWLIGISIAYGWIMAVGCLALFNDRVSIIVLGIGSVIVGIAANYPLHFLDHLKHESNPRNALKEMVPPLLIGNITTVSAFLCLAFIEAKAMRDLGIFGSLMLVATIIFVLIFLPCLTGKRAHLGDRVHTILPDVKRTMPTGMHRYLFPLVIVLTVVFGYLSLDTTFDPDMQHINYMTKEQRRDLKLLSTSLEANDTLVPVFAVAKGNSLDEALRANETLLKQVAGTPYVHSVVGIGNLMPSAVEKEIRLKKWQTYWMQHEDIIAATKTEAKERGFSEAAFTPFYMLCNGEVTMDNDDNPLMELLGKNYIRQDASGQIRIVNILHVEKEQTETVKQTLRKAIGQQRTNAFVFDSKDVSNSLVTVLSDSFNYIGFVCGFVVFAFLWLSFGRLELTFIAFLPLAVSWLWILGLMDLASVQFNIVNIILATFIFGQGDDYSIFITEGLIYEYTYGKKRLKTYKNSVALSAILMFIGIGSLIFAKHPALRSLAEVAMIGMFIVVLMTFYFPPLVFRWLTTKRGKMREIPITFRRLVYSVWAFMFFLFFSMFAFVPYANFQRLFLSRSRKCRYAFHRVLQAVSRFVIYRVPGVRFQYINKVNETFRQPALIICNHQSHLDVMCLLMMSPKIIILTNDWVWHNPFYGAIIRAAEFYPVSNGIDNIIPRLRDLVQRGYSVMVFPEGTREAGRDIMPFYQGAFSIAKQLHIDVLPTMIHGLVDVLPKKDFMLRRGSITLEVHRRMKAEEVAEYKPRELAKMWHSWYVDQYEKMSRRLETADYWLPTVAYKYMYKSHDVEKHSKRVLKDIRRGKLELSRYIHGDSTIVIPDSGYGEVAWVAALAYPQHEVYAYEKDEEKYAVAVNISHRPQNLHFINAVFSPAITSRNAHER